jgi:two-component sensor histidine kinase
MALIHEELYESENQEKLDFTAYLRKLTKELFIFYKAGSSKIKLQMDFKEEIFLDMDIAIPLGMIVNELVTNSLKHAFPSGSGEIKIEFYRIKANKIAKKSVNSGTLKNSKFILIISDNGSGFPKSINFENPGTLGLQLVKTLIEQINGKIRFKGYPATKIEIEFVTSIF